MIQTVARYTKILYAHHWKGTPEPRRTGHVPRTNSVPCGLFLKKGGTISCVVTGPCQPRYSRDLEKLYSVISSASSSVSANLHVPFPHKVYCEPIRTGPRKYSVPSLMVSITR